MQNYKPPTWYWIIAAVALLWNGLGVAAYITEITMTATDFASLSQAEQELYANRPYWASAAFAVAVISGFGGSIMLLLRKRIAVRLFLLSLIAVLIQLASYFILDGYDKYFAEQGWFMPVLIPFISAVLLYFARWSERRKFLL